MSGIGEGCRKGGCGERRLLWREGGDERGRNDIVSSMFGGGNYMIEYDEGEMVACFAVWSKDLHFLAVKPGFTQEELRGW